MPMFLVNFMVSLFWIARSDYNPNLYPDRAWLAEGKFRAALRCFFHRRLVPPLDLNTNAGSQQQERLKAQNETADVLAARFKKIGAATCFFERRQRRSTRHQSAAKDKRVCPQSFPLFRRSSHRISNAARQSVRCFAAEC